MRAVFFGTPALAVPSLVALAELAEITGVVTQPDRPAGRGMKTQAPAVKLAALERNLDVFQPQKVRTGELTRWVSERAPDVALVIAYGRILPDDVLSAPRRGCLNLHASLLPKYRGAAPINWAIANGETETGVSLMQMDAGLDTGPVFAREALAIGPEETAGELAARISELAARVVRLHLERAVRGELVPEAQDDARASHAPLIETEHRRVDFSRTAEDIANLVRGMAPAPGAFTTVSGKRLRLGRVRPVREPPSGAAGTVRLAGGSPVVVAGAGAVEIVSAQLEGKREVSGRDLVNGRVLAEGTILGGSD
ncbi:MAG TPA: methionyl-tRNA formyltransferase [Polyangiaceae bacterium]